MKRRRSTDRWWGTSGLGTPIESRPERPGARGVPGPRLDLT
jgi:hypothetical protein